MLFFVKAQYHRQGIGRKLWEYLLAKLSDGIEAQKEKLEAEGHTIVPKGRKNIKYYVQNYENELFCLE